VRHVTRATYRPPPPSSIFPASQIPYSALHQCRVAYIFDPALEEPAITEKLERFHALLTKDGKGSITNVAHWGKRTLSYAIKKKDTGYYVVAQFETAADLLPEYERAVKLEEAVVRFLVVVSEGLPAKPEAAPAVIAADVVDEIEEDEA
jgi:small subunit ribosomal protein S6